MMRTALAAVVAACLVAIVAAQIPARCASPREWEGRALVRDSRRGQFVEVFSRYAYDETNMRKARYDDVEANRTTERYHVIELFREKKYYALNLRTRKCETGQLTEPFIPHSVVSNATYRGDYVVGSNAYPDSSVEIEIWHHTFTNSKGNKYYWDGQFTRTGCVPIITTVSGPDDFWSESFVDVTLGLSDPNIFVPPSECL